MRSVLVENGLKVSAYLLSSLIVSFVYTVSVGVAVGIVAFGNATFSILSFLIGYFANRSVGRQYLTFKQNVMLMTLFQLISTAGYAYNEFVFSKTSDSGLAYLLVFDCLLAYVIYKIGISFFSSKSLKFRNEMSILRSECHPTQSVASVPIATLVSKYLFNKILVGLLVFCILVPALYFVYPFVFNIPRKVTSYEGVALGMDMAEVKYILGFPDSVLHPLENLNKENGKIMMGQIIASRDEIDHSRNGVDDFLDWQFERGIKRIDVGFDNSTRRVKSIGCYVDSRSFVDTGTCAVNGIQASDSEEVILDKLGIPSTSIIDDATKIVEYSNLNMKIYLVKKTVYRIIVQNY